MNTTKMIAGFLAGILLVLLTACGGSDAPTGTDTGQGQATSITEQKNRRKLAVLRGQLKGVRNSDDRAEALADIATAGKAMKGLAMDVRKCLKDDDTYVREQALRTLAAIDAGGCRPYLEQGLKDEDEDVRRAAVLAWRSAPVKDISPLFEHLEDEDDPEVQRAIAMTVRDLGEDYHIGQVVRLMDDISVTATKPLIEFLVAQKAVKHVSVLTDSLERSDPTVRTTAARGLGELGVKNASVLETLSRGLEDDSPRVQLASCLSLKKLTKQDFGFNVDATEKARASAVNAWKEWIKQSK